MYPALPEPPPFDDTALRRWLGQQAISVSRLTAGSIRVGEYIQSDDYSSGSSGWYIGGDGSAEFNNVTIRGDLVSSNWDGGSDLSGGPDGTATQGFFLDSSVGSGQLEGSLYVGGKVEVTDTLGNATRLAGGGFIEVEPYSSSQWSGVGRFLFGEEPNGNAQENSIAYGFDMAGGLPVGSVWQAAGWKCLGGGVGDASRLGAPASILLGGRTYLEMAGGSPAYAWLSGSEYSSGWTITNTGWRIYGSSIETWVSNNRMIWYGPSQTRYYSGIWLVGPSSTIAGPRYMSWYLSDETTRAGWIGYGGSNEHFGIYNERPLGNVSIYANNGASQVPRFIVDADGATILYDEFGSEVARIDATWKLRVMREGRRTEALLPAGTLLPFAANSTTKIPTGYLEANGQAVSRTAYADLFAALSTLWGAGDGSTTFNLPDLRGRFVIGYGGASGLTAGAVGGSWNHTHSFSDTFTTGGPSNWRSDVQIGGSSTAANQSHTHSGSVSGTTGAANPPYAAVIWMIKV